MILVGSGGTLSVTGGTVQNVTEILGNATISGTTVSGTPMTLTKNGAATLVLAGVNTYTGGTMINDGVLQFGGDDAVPAGSANITINSGGALAMAPTGTYSTVTGWLTSGKIAAGSAGALVLLANDSEAINLGGSGSMGSAATGNMTGSAAPEPGGYGNLSLGAAGNVTYSGTLTPSGTAYNLGGGGGMLTFTPAITGAMSLHVNGPGTVLLTGSDTYTGGTAVAGGTLDFDSSAALPSVGIVNVSRPGTVDLTSLLADLLATSTPSVDGDSDLADAAAAADAIETTSPAGPNASVAGGGSGASLGSTGPISETPAAAAVPEPSTLVLLAAGVIGLIGWARHRHRQRLLPRISPTINPAASARGSSCRCRWE